MAFKGRGKLDKGNKTARIYKYAGRILHQLGNGIDLRTSLDSLNIRVDYRVRLLAMIHKILSHRAELEYVVSKTGIEKELYVDPNVLRVLVHELLFLKKEFKFNSITSLTVNKYKKALKHALHEYYSLELNTVSSSSFEISLEHPRYVRVNTLKSTVDEVISHLSKDGFQFVKYDDDILYEDFISVIQKLKDYEFLCDMHVDNLLIFSSKASLLEHPLYLSGTIILQNKASCVAAAVLKPCFKHPVLDACAAPGMKASHLAALLENQGNILAVDLSADRMTEMEKLLDIYGVTCCTLKVFDFTSLNSNDMPYKKVRRISLDPSCSGSGMVKRNLYFNEDPLEVDWKRIRCLATFQLAMLRKALSFPRVKRVVYSTCSIHRLENEDIVKTALSEFSDRFQLTPSKRFSQFLNADEADEELKNKCLKFIPDRDLTIGFFVAIFSRIKDAAKNEIPISEETDPEPRIHEKKRKGSQSQNDNNNDETAKVVNESITFDEPMHDESSLKVKKVKKEKKHKRKSSL